MSYSMLCNYCSVLENFLQRINLFSFVTLTHHESIEMCLLRKPNDFQNIDNELSLSSYEIIALTISVLIQTTLHKHTFLTTKYNEYGKATQ